MRFELQIFVLGHSQFQYWKMKQSTIIIFQQHCITLNAELAPAPPFPIPWRLYQNTKSWFSSQNWRLTLFNPCNKLGSDFAIFANPSPQGFLRHGSHTRYISKHSWFYLHSHLQPIVNLPHTWSYHHVKLSHHYNLTKQFMPYLGGNLVQ